MENSYRFLMMAATLIVGILLLSMLVYVFRAGARASKAVDEAQIEQQLIAENAKFEHYSRTDNNVSDMISLINLVYNYNRTRDFAPSDCVNVVISVGSQKYYIGEDTSVPGITKKSSELKRNEVWYSEETTPQLINTMLTNTNLTGSFNKIVPNGDGGYVDDGTTTAAAGDTLSLTRYDPVRGTTIYKYLFVISETTYDINSGRIKTMKFKAFINSTY